VGKSGPHRVEDLIGAVARGSFGAGSKSERQAVWFETAKGRFVLRRKEGPTFGDKALEQYVGKRVRCSGFVVDYTLLAERIEILP
jgi:hypothetical protein